MLFRSIAALLVVGLVRTFIAQPYYMPNASMEDTVLPGDRVLALKTPIQLGDVERGQVIVFSDPGGWYGNPVSSGALQSGLAAVGLAPDPGDYLVKRVIAVAGDHITCCDDKGRITLNGESLREPYLKPGVPTDQVTFDVNVPPGSLFVMGDNRADSLDSRYHLNVNSGGVPITDVVGRAVAVVWPPGRFARLPALVQ